MSKTLSTEEEKATTQYDEKNIRSIKINVDGASISIDDLIKSYRKSKKLKSAINKNALSYYHRNRESVLKKMKMNKKYSADEKPRIKHECACGASVLMLDQHLKTLRHLSYMEKSFL